MPANWDAQLVPRSFDSVNIAAAGTYTVTMDTNVSILNLTLGGASGQQTLTNAAQTLSITNTLITANGIFGFGGGTFTGGLLTDQGTFNWGGGTVAIPITVAAAGTLTVNGTAVNLEGALTNAGTIHWSGTASSISVYNNHSGFSGAIYNQADALFDIQNDLAIYSAGYGFEFFQNAGTVRKSADAGVTSFNIAFTNAATVDAQSGTIQFAGGGNIGGSYNTASGATIQFASGSYTETGTVTNTGTGLFRQYGATVTLNDRITKFILVNGNVALSPTFEGSGAIQNLQLDGAYLTGTNLVTGTLGFNGGGMASASPLTVTSTGVLDFNGGPVNIYASLTNAGTINWSGSTLTVYNNAGVYTGAIYNQPGGFFVLQSDQSLSSAGYGLEFFSNFGTVRKTAGLGTSYFNLLFTNAGTVDAQSGTIRFGAGGTIGGAYNTASGAIVEFDNGSFVQSGAPNVTGSGLCRQNGATVTLNDRIINLVLAAGSVVLSPTFQTDGTIHNLQLDGAYLAGTNTVTGILGFNGGGMASTSPLSIAATGVLDFNGGPVNIYAPLTNAGTINWSGSTLTVYNNASAYTGVVYNLSGGSLILQSDQSLSSAGYGFEFFSNAGTVRKTAGLGTSTFSLAFANAGTLDAQSGTIRIAGPYTQTGGTMNFGITSLAYFGQIAFSANAPLTGALSVNFNDGYFPSAGDSFALLTYASRAGVFTSLALPSQAQWQTNYSASTFTLSVLSVTGGGGAPVTLTPVSLAAGNFTLRINGSVGPSYILQASSDLITWTALSTNTPSLMPFTVIDTNAGSFNHRFYRALLGP